MTVTVVLHVVESWGAGVRAAVLQFVAATPERRAPPAARREARRVRLRRRARASRASRVLPAGVRRRPSRHPPRSRAGASPTSCTRTRPTRACSCAPPCAVAPDRRLVYSPHCFAFERRDLNPAGAARDPRDRAHARPQHRHDRGVLARRGPHGIPRCASGGSSTCRTSRASPRSRCSSTATRTGSSASGASARRRTPTSSAPRSCTCAATATPTSTPAGSATATTGSRACGSSAPASPRAAGSRRSTRTRRSGRPGCTCTPRAGRASRSSILEAIELGVPVIAREVPTMAGAIATPGITHPRADGGRGRRAAARRRHRAAREPRGLAATSRREHAGAAGARPRRRVPRVRPAAGADQRQVAERAAQRHAAVRGRGRPPGARPRPRGSGRRPSRRRSCRTGCPPAAPCARGLRGIAFEQVALPWHRPRRRCC